MCLLIAEIIMLIGGLVGLITGKIRLSKNMELQGWRARVAGLILALPLPLAFGVGLVLGVLVGAGVLPSSTTGLASLIELPIVLACLVAAVIFAWATKPQETPGQAPPAQM